MRKVYKVVLGDESFFFEKKRDAISFVSKNLELNGQMIAVKYIWKKF